MAMFTDPVSVNDALVPFMLYNFSSGIFISIDHNGVIHCAEVKSLIPGTPINGANLYVEEYPVSIPPPYVPYLKELL